MGYRTIVEGNRALITDVSGGSRFVDGPSRAFLWRSTVQPLVKMAADHTQALRVRWKDGGMQQMKGPTFLWFNPLKHQSVEVVTVTPISLTQGEALVVYTKTEHEVKTSVIHGPALHLPDQKEWIHKFSWTGRDPRSSNKANKKSGVLNFTKLRTTPEKLYFDVVDTRTADDALLTFKLMVFYELIDVEKMLQLSRDPIADIISAGTADVIAFAASRSFKMFKQETGLLNDLASYPQLSTQSEQIGFKITKVVFRGYVNGSELQGTHDAAIEQGTSLALDRFMLRLGATATRPDHLSLPPPPLLQPPRTPPPTPCPKPATTLLRPAPPPRGLMPPDNARNTNGRATRPLPAEILPRPPMPPSNHEKNGFTLEHRHTNVTPAVTYQLACNPNAQ